MVYKLVAKHKKEGSKAYKAKKAGKPKTSVNPSFVKKVVEIRKSVNQLPNCKQISELYAFVDDRIPHNLNIS